MTGAWDGRPENPERDGWHWLCAAVGIGAPYPMLWSADGKAWDTGDGWVFCTDPALTERRRYLGPCLLPEEVAAREAAAAVPKPVRVRASISVVQSGQKSDALADLPAWRPIATAPKCGTIWLALWEDTGPVVGCWHRGAWRTRDKGYPLRPTHWLPLPAINEGRDD